MLASILFLAGSLFFAVAARGLFALPDPLARLHAGTRGASLGTLLMVAGAALARPEPWATGLAALTALFVFVTAPLASHAIARRLVDRPDRGDPTGNGS